MPAKTPKGSPLPKHRIDHILEFGYGEKTASAIARRREILESYRYKRGTDYSKIISMESAHHHAIKG